MNSRETDKMLTLFFICVFLYFCWHFVIVLIVAAAVAFLLVKIYNFFTGG